HQFKFKHIDFEVIFIIQKAVYPRITLLNLFEEGASFWVLLLICLAQMEPLSRPEVVKLPLPPGLKASTVVGRGGHNVRWIHFHSGGAHITVNDTGITIRAKEIHVRERAFVLVQRQLDAAKRLAITHDGVPSSPRLDYILLEAAFGTDPRVRFRHRQDEVVSALGLKDKLFELAPAAWDCGSPNQLRGRLCDVAEGPMPKRDQDGERDQDLARMWDRQQQPEDDTDGATRFHAATAVATSNACVAASTALATAAHVAKRSGSPPLLASAARALAAAAHKAACREPSFDVLKIRFKLGKSLFRNLGPRAGRTDLSVAELEGAGAGRGCFQSVFSTWVPSSAVPRVTSWLTDSLGFCLADTKTTATLHVINQELNIHYSIALAMERGDDSTASLRKVKAGGSKNPSVTLMAAPQQLDLRLKLISQFREHPALACDADAHSTARRVAAAVRMEGFEGFTRSKRGLPRNRHLEYARHKTKFVYEGYLPTSGGGGQRLRVSVTQVQDDKGTHFEISGGLPKVDATLRQLLTIHQQEQQQKHAQQQRPLRRQLSAEVSHRSNNWAIPRWQRYSCSSSGGDAGAGAGASVSRGDCQLCERAVTGSICSFPGPSHNSSPPADAELNAPHNAMWAEAALSTLSEFLALMNRHLCQEGAMTVAAAPLGTP
ncbi:hypothetical protein VaNZ11_015418, partial [Volvox africanus]